MHSHYLYHGHIMCLAAAETTCVSHLVCECPRLLPLDGNGPLLLQPLHDALAKALFNACKIFNQFQLHISSIVLETPARYHLKIIAHMQGGKPKAHVRALEEVATCGLIIAPTDIDHAWNVRPPGQPFSFVRCIWQNQDPMLQKGRQVAAAETSRTGGMGYLAAWRKTTVPALEWPRRPVTLNPRVRIFRLAARTSSASCL